MKTLTKTIAITALTLSSIGFANANPVLVPGNDYVTTELCLIASQGNKTKLVNAIKKAGLTKRFVAQNVKCNEQNFVEFVEQYGSNVTKINNYLTGGAYSEGTEMPDLAAR